MSKQPKRYGGYPVAAIREFIAHSIDTGESIDSITGDDATSTNIIRDLLDEIAKSKETKE